MRPSEHKYDLPVQLREHVHLVLAILQQWRWRTHQLYVQADIPLTYQRGRTGT